MIPREGITQRAFIIASRYKNRRKHFRRTVSLLILEGKESVPNEHAVFSVHTSVRLIACLFTRNPFLHRINRAFHEHTILLSEQCQVNAVVTSGKKPKRSRIWLQCYRLPGPTTHSIYDNIGFKGRICYDDPLQPHQHATSTLLLFILLTSTHRFLG